MPLWSICTQADAIYANIISPKIVPINFTPIAHQWGHAFRPTYGCMPIFGRENPYICVIGTISGYIWQYICGRPYAVSGSAYSASLLQGGPRLYTNFRGDALQRNIVHCRTLWYSVIQCKRPQCTALWWSCAVQCILQCKFVHWRVTVHIVAAELWSFGT